MRIRSIKPEIWADDTVCSLSQSALILYIGLWNYVDDNGVGVDREYLIATSLYPKGVYDNPHEYSVRTHGGLTELSDAGLIIRYSAKIDGARPEIVPLLEIVGWDELQYIARPGKPRYPRHDAVHEGSCNLHEGSCNLHEGSCNLHEGSVRAHANDMLEQGTGNREQGAGITMRTFGDPKDAPQVEHTADAPESIVEQPALIDAPDAPDSESRDHVSGDPAGDPGPDQPSRHEQLDATQPAQPTGSRYSAEFEQWWDGYPVKRGKAKAYKAFKKARRRASLETLTQGRDRYAAWLAAHPDRSPKWAEGWLNGDRWEDDLTSGDPTNSSGGGGGVIDMWRKAQELHASRPTWPGIRPDWTSTHDDLEPEPYSPPPQLASTIAQIAAGLGAG